MGKNKVHSIYILALERAYLVRLSARGRTIYFSSRKVKLKAAVRNFFWLKNDPKSIFEQVHNQPVFKTIALLYHFDGGLWSRKDYVFMKHMWICLLYYIVYLICEFELYSSFKCASDYR